MTRPSATYFRTHVTVSWDPRFAVLKPGHEEVADGTPWNYMEEAIFDREKIAQADIRERFPVEFFI